MNGLTLKKKKITHWLFNESLHNESTKPVWRNSFWILSTSWFYKGQGTYARYMCTF